jgi:hypothetical protein
MIFSAERKSCQHVVAARFSVWLSTHARAMPGAPCQAVCVDKQMQTSRQKYNTVATNLSLDVEQGSPLKVAAFFMQHGRV